MSTMEGKEDYAVEAYKPREVTVAFSMSEEALRRVLDKIPRHPATEVEGKLIQLAVGFMSLCEGLRDEQHRIRRTTDDGQVIELDVPTLRRLDDLKEAGRVAALAITQMQAAILYARRAAELAR